MLDYKILPCILPLRGRIEVRSNLFQTNLSNQRDHSWFSSSMMQYTVTFYRKFGNTVTDLKKWWVMLDSNQRPID